MSWDEIRHLQGLGVEFGSHTCTHPHLTGLSNEDVVREAARSRAIITRELDRPVVAFAYPYGDADPSIHHLVGASGYAYGLTCRPGTSDLKDNPLALPRIEVSADMELAAFISALGG